MLPDKLPKWVHRKQSKGWIYLYFDTGKVDLKGKRVFVRLPAYQDAGFHRAYANLRDRREGTGKAAFLTVPALCEAFRKGWARRKKPLAKATRESYETYLKVIEHEFNTFPAVDVAPSDIVALMDKMVDRPGAANQVVRTMSAMYTWANRPKNGLVPQGFNPATGSELYEEGEHEPWPDALLEQALKADDAFVRLTVNMLYYGGQRLNDTLMMGWRKILGDIEFMAVKQEKTDTELEIAIHSDLRALLRSMPRTLGTIIAKPNGTRYSKERTRDRLQKWAAERGFHVVPHGLRKNAVNGLLEAGCSAAEVASISGQSLQMIEHYAKKRDRKKLSGSAVLKWENAR
jgi:hypothetical protein